MLTRESLGELQRHPLVGKLVRFAMTGAVSGIVFAAVTLLSLRLLPIRETMAVVIGYIAVLPLSFIGHRKLTFRSAGRVSPEFVRFCISFILGLLASVVAMHVATQWLAMPPFLGVVGAILVVPIITFVVMNLWVFRDQN
jgi:putative flippase GtrA